MRATGDGQDLALAKVVARMLGVPTDDVRKRQVSAQNWRLKVTAAVVTVFVLPSWAKYLLLAGFPVRVFQCRPGGQQPEAALSPRHQWDSRE